MTPALSQFTGKGKLLGHGSVRIIMGCFWFILCKFLSTLFVTSALSSGKDLYYRGSVVEMYPRGSVSFSPMLNINMTIDAMETYIRRASEEDTADIIVFPEAILWTFGLVAPGNSTMSPRDRLAQYGETLPPVGTLPCNDASVHNNFLFRFESVVLRKSILYH